MNTTHCIIHRDLQDMSPELYIILGDAVKIVNTIKSSPKTSRLLAALYSKVGVQHSALLLHSEVCWLSHRKVLSRLLELITDIEIVFNDKKSPLAHRMDDDDWVIPE